MNKPRTILERFNALGSLDSLKREGRDFNFADVHQYIIETYNALNDIVRNQSFWDSLPENVRSNSTDYFDQFVNYLEEIKNFNPAQGANQSTRDSIANNIRSLYSQLYAPVFLPLEVFRLKQSLVSGDIQELSKSAQITLQEIQKQKSQGDDLIKAIQETAAVGGVSKFTGIFAKEAESHSIAAYIWLTITAIAGALIVWYLYDTFTKLSAALLIVSETGENLTLILQLFFAKVLILSFFSVVFYQIAKNYNANMHLSILNRHRENSLRTFQAFVESTNDPKTKDIILVQSTQTIFTAGDTGYVVSKDSGSPSFDAAKIIEQAHKS